MVEPSHGGLHGRGGCKGEEASPEPWSVLYSVGGRESAQREEAEQGAEGRQQIGALRAGVEPSLAPAPSGLHDAPLYPGSPAT